MSTPLKFAEFFGGFFCLFFFFFSSGDFSLFTPLFTSVLLIGTKYASFQPHPSFKIHESVKE